MPEGLSRKVMIRDSATCKENHRRFVERIIEGETIWYLTNEEFGTANCESHYFEDAIVLMFFSDRAYAQRIKITMFSEFSIQSMSLFDFLFRWLVGMADDGVVAGTNWTGDLVGLEFDPQDLREEIESKMSRSMLLAYLKELEHQIA